MASGVEICDDNLVGRRVKVCWSKDKSFCEGVVSSQSRSGKNLVVCSDAVEEILNREKDNGESVEDVFADQGTQKCDPGHTSSHVLPEYDASKAYGEELVGCKVKVLHLRSKTLSEGVVGSYDHSHKKHWVAFTNGIQELMNLSNHIEPAEDVSADQEKKELPPARDYSSMYADDDMDAHVHVGRKHKREPSDTTPPSACPIMSKDLKIPKLEADIAPTDSKSLSVPGEINGYKVKTTAAPTLEAIFDKYGDIASRCIFKSMFVRASLLEVVCDVVQRLQYHGFEAVLFDLETIENAVSDVEASKIDVSWLHEHLAKLRKIAAFREKYSELRKTKARSDVIIMAAISELEERHAEFLVAQEHLKEAEKRVNAMRLVGRKIDDDMMESESEECLWRRRLDGIL